MPRASIGSVWIDLSKGLGAPAAAVLAGSREFIGMAWRWKQRLGGALRQAGILAAAGIYALRNNVERLAEDHAKARLLARGLAEIGGVRVDAGASGNEYSPGRRFAVWPDGHADARTSAGRRTSAQLCQPSTVIRAVTHLDISEEDIREAIRIFGETLAADQSNANAVRL